ncbi:nucleoside-triphosphatase [Paenibacillus sp. YN15]|uniref:nucleoside-triphosphatase n=1 Tax=Paenibacillus sp. YN15 TaxID=1742774 RepID=UPI000DCD99CA|nr:nucleoside-triphosphatase [Paenibacillus sp. YN15]RAU93464.1 nucleotide kinase [Paenibacillus sp. YN15]
MHVFLTGGIQIGKSTVIRKAVQGLGICPGGFVTGFRQSRANPSRRLYLNPAWEEPAYDEAHAVARFGEGLPPSPDSIAFDQLGCGYLAACRSWAKLLLMDELGSLERDALHFQKAVLQALDGNVPILGVLKQAGHPWMEGIIRHPAVTVIEVTEANRDSLPEQLITGFSDQAHSG